MFITGALADDYIISRFLSMTKGGDVWGNSFVRSIVVLVDE